MSLQAALSKLRGNPSAASSDDRRRASSGLKVGSSTQEILPSGPSHSEGRTALSQGAFDIPFDEFEEDDEVSSIGGLHCVSALGGGAGAGVAPVSGRGDDQSGQDQVEGGRVTAVGKIRAFSFAKLPQKHSISFSNDPLGKSPTPGGGVSLEQGVAPVCDVDDEEEFLSALNDDWLDTELTSGAGGGEHGEGGEKPRQPQCLSVGEGGEKPRQPQCLSVGEGGEKPRQPQCLSVGEGGERPRQPQCLSVGEGGERQEQPAVKRRFPGPAGALPQLPPGQNVQQLLSRQPKRVPKTLCLSSRQRSCDYQHSAEFADFSTDPWKEMERDLQLDSTTAAPLRKYTLSRVLKEAARKRLPSGKVPHLRVRLKTINRGGRNARAVMQDPTGEVCGTVHSEVVEGLGPALTPGAVLLLRQVSVVSPKPRRHYLNITAPNVVALYPPDGGRRTTRSGDFDLSKLITETLTNAENNKQGFPCNSPSFGGSPLNGQPSRPMASANTPVANGACGSHDQQPIGCLPDVYDGELEDLTGVTIEDFNEWDSAEEEGQGEGPTTGQKQDMEGQAVVSASESRGSFFSDLLRSDELANFDDF